MAEGWGVLKQPRGPQGCKHPGCREPATVQVNILARERKKGGKFQYLQGESRMYCNTHALEVYKARVPLPEGE